MGRSGRRRGKTTQKEGKEGKEERNVILGR